MADTVAILPVAPANPGAVIVPERLAPSAGLHLWPQLRLPRGAIVVYVLTVIRPPAAPGLPPRSEAVYVGKTVDLARRAAYHRARAGRRPRSATNKQGPLVPFDDVLYYVEESEWAAPLESGLVKLLLPAGNSDFKRGRVQPLSGQERKALGRWGIHAD